MWYVCSDNNDKIGLYLKNYDNIENPKKHLKQGNLGDLI